MKGIISREKCYVSVVARFDEEGAVTPLIVIWEDGCSYHIDRVLDCRQAASLKVGGTGLRYLVEIGGRRTYLFFEGPRWFVERKVYGEG